MDYHHLDDAALQSIKNKIAGGDQYAFKDLFNCYSEAFIKFAAAIINSDDIAR
jgi:hypothetical protein